jgi:LysM repeat protein
MGYGRLATEANNHFGIKCHSGWTGKKIYHDDDRKGECFRVYKNPETSYRDHSLFLKNRSRYAFIFDIRTSHYKGWAKGLKKAGYATDPKYPDKLISLIERFDLTRFDDKKMKSDAVVKKSSKPKSTQIHLVSKGDTLYSVSKMYNISLEHLVEVNKIKDQTIYLGQELKIPSKP